VIKRLLEEFTEVVVVIGSSESPLSSRNPFSASEREEMVRQCFGPGELERLVIVPVPDINDHSRWVDHVKSHVPAFDAVFSNNELVARLFRQAGIEVRPIVFIDRGNKEGRYIRQLMKEGDPDWKKHVPEEVAQYIEKIKGPERIRRMEGE